MPDLICSVSDCGKAAHCRGWCPMHYQRMRLHGSLDPVFAPPKARAKRVGIEPCEVEGCDKPIKARGWCDLHWTRWSRHGSPTARVRAEVVDGRRVRPHCRIDVPLEDWYVTPSGRFTLCGDCFGEWNRNRGHSRRAPVSGPRFTRREVLDRDGWVCRLCDEEIDRALKHPHPMGATLDHIIPVSRGGEHSLANSQAAHRICNMRKWAHVPDRAVA